MTTTVERMARWAHGLVRSDVPEEVLALCRAQRRSVLAAIAASSGQDAGRRVLTATADYAAPGPAPLVGTDRQVRVEEALHAAAALSIGLDFDDYLCFGHTGHSAVLVPLLLAAETGADGEAQLLAQLAANEIEARLGAGCMIGPLNGQLWSFIHAAGAAVAAGRLLGLTEQALAQAIALSLYQAPRPTVPGFMAPDSKLLTASDPALAGLRAARLAAHGVTGPLDALDHPQGFLSAFSYVPLRPLLEPGEGWATRTLCIKPYPGCAYLGTTLDALAEVGAVAADEVESVTVRAGLLTCGMDGMSRCYAIDRPTAVTVNFSIPWNVAIALSAGRLGPGELEAGWLTDHAAALSALAGRVRLEHDSDLTRRTIDALAPIFAPRAALRDVGLVRLLKALSAMRREHPSISLRPADLRAFASLRKENASPWDDGALREMRMAFPARVRIRLRDGTVHETECDVPRGAAGHPSEGPVPLARAKLEAHGPALFGAEGTAALDRAIEGDDAGLHALLRG